MSTSYYRLTKPITHIRPELAGGHYHVGIWINHGKAGTLVMRAEELKDFLHLFREYEDDMQCPMRTHWGGKDVGAVVTENEPNLPDEMQVISEYGDLLTVGEVRARSGAVRKDGMPTELFGYEPQP